jgi:serine protease Do
MMINPARRLARRLWVLGGIAGVAVALSVIGPRFTSAQVGGGDRPTFASPVSFADVIERVSPAVVTISVEKVARVMPTRVVPRGAPGFEDFFERFFGGQGLDVVPGERRMQGLGSGFVIDEDGYIVTNNHVIDDADEVVVTFSDGTELDAEVIGIDEQTDLALIKVDADHDLAFVSFGDSESARVGDWVLAIGNPFGFGGTVTAGIISARGRDIRSGPYDDYLQIDAPINSGNSGGPVFDAAGEVIGINTAIISPNGGNIGIGLAIPARQAAAVIEQLRSDGTVTRGWLGVQIQEIDEDLAEALGIDGDVPGVLVAEVMPDSPAERAGIESGDVITRYGGVDVDGVRELQRLVSETAPGVSRAVEVIRDGDLRKLSVSTGDLNARTGRATLHAQRSGGSELGLTLRALSDTDRRELGVPEHVEGVVIESVERGSLAAEKGLAPGDVITEVNRERVATVEDALDALRRAESRRDRALLLVRRGESQRYIALSFG